MAALPAAPWASDSRERRPAEMAVHDDSPQENERHSYDTGESSATGSLLASTPAMKRARGAQLEGEPGDTGYGVDKPRHSNGPVHHDDRTKRKQRQRATSAFLLHDALPKDRDGTLRRRTQKSVSKVPGPSPQTPDQSRQVIAHHSFDSIPAAGQQSGRTPDSISSNVYDQSPEQQGSPSMDMDSTQIVQMALNLSESRRVASRRHASRANPPKLAPLPDPSNGSSLRQHLQQQRRTSRNISPKPGQGLSTKIPSTVRANSPLQTPFLSNPEGRYRYQFSASTLARAQKAKEHLELMAEYRRLLDHLPPLTPAGHAPGSRTSPNPGPSSPNTGLQANGGQGRHYNPLQYIRNRKVRARERKVIDGEKQGFGDVECVRAWVDKLSQQTQPAGHSPVAKATSMPPFPGADQLEPPNSPEPLTKTPTRVRRPRVDWFLEPCDMIADAYWLEQNHHKYLIEDRQRRKIFPHPPQASLEQDNPVEQRNGVMSLPLTTAPSTIDFGDTGLAKVDTDLTQSSTKERAKQKLQDITGFHHRHSNSVNNHHDFLRRRRESFSDLSGSDSESKTNPQKKVRHGRSGTITSNSNDLLQKQMMEMIAREAQEKDLANVLETDAEHFEPTTSDTPERIPTSTPSSQFASRKGSVADTSDSDYRPPIFDKPRWGVPPKQRTGRQSLEVPDQHWQGSTDIDLSLPTSPELKAARDVAFVPSNGLDSSQPSSRAASPSRNPLSKVKQILREKGREAGFTHRHEERDESRERRHSLHELTPPKRTTSPDKSSPVIDGRPTRSAAEEGHRGHRRTASLRPRMDDPGVGLRGMFKGPRIDTVIRGGVSKLGDMLWKKDGSSDDHPVGETDESDVDAPRGRRRSSTLAHIETKQPQEEPHSTSRNFLDTMPTFHHVANSHRMPGPNGDSKSVSTEELYSPDHPASRFELLKPPRIDIRSATAASPSLPAQTHVADSEVSDVESNISGVDNALQTARTRGNMLEVRKSSEGALSRRQSRHWSIADQNPVEPKRLSRREVARIRALILSSGIKAMEISKRADEVHKPFEDTLSTGAESSRANLAGIHWDGIAQVSPALSDLRNSQVAFCELYPLAAKALGISIQASGQRWQQAADHFTSKTSPDLRRRMWSVRQRVNDDLSNMTRSAADEADETSRDLALGQPLKVKHVVDTIENMLRKRRRRFRWVRRGLWLTVEWALVGFMWYVWFVVMILRIFWGVGRGVWSGVRWLLWL
ncbi:hypothetical protein HJFPF1_01173 [Paramyrothecium foliicola]|nr:hypothetical protein HJFPF1_01173 [Paramyrothecium foliicola]